MFTSNTIAIMVIHKQQTGDRMKIETLRKKATWELKVMVKALSQPVSSFLNTEEDNLRLENAKQVLNERRRKQ